MNNYTFKYEGCSTDYSTIIYDYENNVYLFLTSCGEIFPNIIISSLSDSLNPYENLIWSGVVINTDSDSPNQNLNDINSNSFEEFSNEFFFLKTKKLGNV